MFLMVNLSPFPQIQKECTGKKCMKRSMKHTGLLCHWSHDFMLCQRARAHVRPLTPCAGLHGSPESTGTGETGTTAAAPAQQAAQLPPAASTARPPGPAASAGTPAQAILFLLEPPNLPESNVGIRKVTAFHNGALCWTQDGALDGASVTVSEQPHGEHAARVPSDPDGGDRGRCWGVQFLRWVKARTAKPAQGSFSKAMAGSQQHDNTHGYSVAPSPCCRRKLTCETPRVCGSLRPHSVWWVSDISPCRTADPFYEAERFSWLKCPFMYSHEVPIKQF